MAYPKRLVPVTDEERKARNREYQQRRRQKTNNSYPRAYRRAMQRAAEFVQTNHPELWERWLAEETAKDEKRPYTPLPRCQHDGDRWIAGVMAGCSLCGELLGSMAVDEDLRADISEQLGLHDPPPEVVKRRQAIEDIAPKISPWTKVKR